MTGQNAVVANNYFQGLGSNAINIHMGDHYGVEQFGFIVPDNLIVVHNTIVDCEYGINRRKDCQDCDKAAKDVKIVNNLFYGSGVHLSEDPGLGELCAGNFLFHPTNGKATLFGCDEGSYVRGNPAFMISSDYDMYRLSATSEAIGVGLQDWGGRYLGYDIDLQLRVGAADAGCDQFSTNSIKFSPLTEYDVGPGAPTRSVDHGYLPALQPVSKKE